MRKSRLSKYKQNRLIELFVAGATARTAASLVGVNKSTSSYYFHRLRELIYRNDDDAGLLAGEIEIDESYFGGKRKGNEVEGRRVKSLYLAYLSAMARCMLSSYPMLRAKP
jgi:transposase